MSEVFRRLLRWSKGNAAVIGFSFFVFLFSFSDKCLCYSNIWDFNFNGWVSVLHSHIPTCFLLLAPFFVLGAKSRYVYIPYFLAGFVFQVIGWFVQVNFKMMLDGDLVGIILNSSVDEMLFFIKHYAMSFLLIFFLFGGFIIAVWRLCKLQGTKTSIVTGFVFILLFFYGANVLEACVNKNFGYIEQRFFGVHLVMDCFRKWDDFKKLVTLKDNPQFPQTISLTEGDGDDVIGVFVLGESATRSHWGLYGYERKTTPNMDARKSELVIFNDLVTPFGSTSASMRYMFTTRTIEKPDDLRFTLSQALKRVGYRVALFSNQERWGEFGGEESFNFAGCNPMLFMNELEEANAYDDVLLPHFKRFIAQGGTRTIAFLHLRGSHTPAWNGYPKDVAPFEPGVCAHNGNVLLQRNHYDNSIWYTDKLLGRIIDELEALHKPTWLLYLSDHGETPSSKSWRTQTDNDLWEVPFIVWTSKEFKEMFPDKINALNNATKLPLQSDQLLYGVLSFCGVKGLEVDPSEDFLSPTFKCREKRKIQNGRVEYMKENGR